MAHPFSVINNPTAMIDIGHIPPEISVVMPMYNAAPYLRACIDSVLSQSFKDFEFVIVDDGSTDDSVRIVESYNDSRVRLIKNEHDFITRVRDNILKSKEQKNIQPTKGGHKMVTCQNYVSLFYCQITSCPSDGGIS